MRPDEVLAQLEPGRAVWIEVHGSSMRPLLNGGEELHVVRCDERALVPGDIAILSRSDGALIAHLVAGTAPLVTSSFSGVHDPPGLTLLGRADAVRKGRLALPLTRPTQDVLVRLHRAWVSGPAQLGRELLKSAVTSGTTAAARERLLGPLSVELGNGSAPGVAAFLGRFTTLAPAALERLPVAVARGRLGIVAAATADRAFVSWLASGLGLERRLADALPKLKARAPAPAKKYRAPTLTDVPFVQDDALLQAVGGRWMAASGDAQVHAFTEADGAVSDVAERIAELIDGARTVSTIVDVVCGEFDVDRPTCEADTLAFIGVLVERRVLALR